MPPKAFDVEKDGLPIDQVQALHSVSTGIEYGPSWLPGILISPFEEYSAMVRANWNEHEWKALTWQERARAVAFYRLSQHVDLHRAESASTSRRDAEISRMWDE